MFKIYACVLAFICIALALHHNFQTGTKKSSDRLLFSHRFAKEPKMLQIATQEVQFPQNGTQGVFSINFVNCTDTIPSSKGGFVAITDGGINQSFITLTLYSQRGEGYDFLVQIWGTHKI